MGRIVFLGESKTSQMEQFYSRVKSKIRFPLFPAAAAVGGGTSNGYCLVGPDLIHSSTFSCSSIIFIFLDFFPLFQINSKYCLVGPDLINSSFSLQHILLHFHTFKFFFPNFKKFLQQISWKISIFCANPLVLSC